MWPIDAFACSGRDGARGETDRQGGTRPGSVRQDSRDLDAAIGGMHNSAGSDLLRVQRLKKRKLHLRDHIIQIEDKLTPDIIA